MSQVTVKRSMSPDGKIDAVSVEITFEADPATDQQAILDVIKSTDAYASEIRVAPQQYSAPQPSSNGNGLSTVSGTVQAVFDGEPSKVSGKLGPSSIIVDGQKVKTFDRNLAEKARTAKANGNTVTATYARNEKWKSNDLKDLTIDA